MKKLVAFALSAVMLACPMTAYAAPTADGIAVYEELMAKSAEMNDVHAYYDMNVKLSGSVFEELSSYLGGSDLTMRLEMDMRGKNMNDLSAIQFFAYCRVSMMGEQMDMSMYYGDNWMYMEADGTKQKMEMPLGTMQASMGSLSGYSSLASSVEYMTDLSVRYEGENRILSYRMDNAKIDQLVQAALTQTGYSQDMAGMTMKVRDVYGEYVVAPDGTYNHATMHMVMDMAMYGETITMTMDGIIGIPNPGEAVEMPALDLASYPSM